MAFDYDPININDINRVEIVSRDDNGYQRFLKKIYNSDDSGGSEAMYERWAREYPSIAREYKNLAEQALEDPHQLADELDEEIFRGQHDSLKSKDLRYVVRYPNHAERYGLWVYNGDTYSDRVVKRTTYGLIDDLRGLNGADRQQKACLQFAYSETFKTADEVPDHSFNQLREEGLLRHMDSSQSNTGQQGTGGLKFEQEVRQRLSNYTSCHYAIEFSEFNSRTVVSPTKRWMFILESKILLLF